MATPLIPRTHDHDLAAPALTSKPAQLTCSERDDATGLLAIATLVLAALFAGLCATLLVNGLTTTGQLSIYAIFVLVGPVLAIAVFVGLARFAIPPGPARRLARLASVFVFGATFLWTLQGIDRVIYGGDQPHMALDRFRVGTATGIALVLLACVLLALLKWLTPERRAAARRRFARPATVVSITLAILTAVLLFDARVYSETLSYAPYTGPATIVLHGGVPLRDAYSQYGLNYLLMVPALSLLPYSFATAAAVVSTINVLYYLAFLAIALRARHKAVIALAATLILLFVQASYYNNPSKTPSVLGMRFFAPLLLTVAIAYLPPRSAFSVASVVCLVLTSVWSVEALCYGAIAYAVYLLVRGRWLRLKVREIGVQLLLLAGWLALPHALLIVSYLLLFHAPPDYATYLQLVVGATDDPSTRWTMVADAQLHAWALFGWAYGLGLVYAMYRASRAPRRDAAEAGRVAVLASLCALGAAELTYYVARSSTPLLVFLSLPLALVGLWALDHSLGELRTRTPAQLAVLAATALVVPLMLGVFADRFFGSDEPGASTSTLLRAALTPQPDAPFVIGTWNDMRKTAPFDADDVTSSPPYLQADTAFHLFEKWRSNGHDPILVLPESATVLFFARAVSPLGLAHPAVDGLSANLTRRALGRVDAITSGDIVIVGDPDVWSQKVPLDQAVLGRVQQRCALSQIEQVNEYPKLAEHDWMTVTVYRVSCPDSGVAPGQP